MSTAGERLAAIKANYDQACDNEGEDIAKADDAAQCAAIQANVASARTAYYGAVNTMLTNSGQGVEQAYQAALTASDEVKKARTKTEAISSLIGKLTTATAKATDLLNKAKKL